jgi:hypothetical protein
MNLEKISDLQWNGENINLYKFGFKMNYNAN